MKIYINSIIKRYLAVFATITTLHMVQVAVGWIDSHLSKNELTAVVKKINGRGRKQEWRIRIKGVRKRGKKELSVR